MLETIKELISQYLPAITSIGGTILAVVTFFANIKKILEKKDTETKTLKTQLTDLQALFSDVTVKNSYTNETLVSELKSSLEANELLKEEVTVLKSQVASVEEQSKEITELIRDNTVLKQQLTSLLRKEQEGE